MHKDPPPTLLERSFAEIMLHGVVTGFVASVLFFGAWSLVSADRGATPQRSTLPLPPRPAK